MLIKFSVVIDISLFYVVLNDSRKKGGKKKNNKPLPCVVFTSIAKVTKQ